MPFTFSNGLINKDKTYKVIKQEYERKVKRGFNENCKMASYNKS